MVKKMSYDRIGNCNVRSNGRKVNIFDKVNSIKAELKEILPEVDGEKLVVLFSKVRTFYLHKKKGVPVGRAYNGKFRKMTEIEELLYGYLLKNGLNPSTTYRWFIATRIPVDVKHKLATNQISYKTAMQISANRRRTKNSVQGLILMEEIRAIVQKLDWRG